MAELFLERWKSDEAFEPGEVSGRLSSPSLKPLSDSLPLSGASGLETVCAVLLASLAQQTSGRLS